MTDSSPSSTYHRHELAKDAAEVHAFHESNRQGWNEGAVRYTEWLEKSIAKINAHQSSLHPIERANLRRPGIDPLLGWCGLAIHLQCASGEDTLSLWLEGASRVIGVDISDVHIENARKLTAATQAPAEWYRCDLLDTPHALDGTADLVYTGQGALCWIHDLDAWAGVVARLLKPGGVFHVLDDHPMSWMFEQDADTLRYAEGMSYFNYAEAAQGWPTTYIGDLGKKPEELSVMYERLWPLASIHAALTGAGLRVDYLGEHPDDYWNSYPNLKPEYRGLIPMTFSMRAIKA